MNTLEFKIQDKATHKSLPFTTTIINGTLTLIVDTESLASSNNAVEAPTAISYIKLAEFPAELVHLVNPLVFKWLALAGSEKGVDKIDNPKILETIKPYRESLEAETTKWKLEHPDNKECPSCITGKINRMYILQLLPFLYTIDTSSMLIELIELLINYVNKGIAQKLPNAPDYHTTFAKALADAYFAEFRSNGVSCPDCKVSAIKTKYNHLIIDKIKELLKFN